MGTYFQAFLMIFIAEMGDKTQLLAMTFATKYKIKDIVVGVMLGSALNHGLAIVLGGLLTQVIPIDAMGVIAGTLFLYFAFMSLVIDDDELEDEKTYRLPFLTVALAFFIGELGDKTQLTALTLSTQYSNGWLVLAGTVSGMVLTSLIGIFIGIKLGNKIPETGIKVGAFALFTFFGLEKLISSVYRETLPYWTQGLIFGIILVVMLYRMITFLKKSRETGETAYQLQAQRLKEYMAELSIKTEELCLGESVCNTCLGTGCLVGYMRDVLSGGEIFGFEQDKVNRILRADLSQEKAKEMMEVLLDYYSKYPNEFATNETLTSIRKVIEKILQIKMTARSYEAYNKEWKDV